MQRTITTIILLTAACSYTPPDPCADTSPLQQDPKVAADCQAMAGGETGGSEPTNDLACYSGDAMPWCALMDTTAQDFSDVSTYTITDIGSCSEYAQTTVAHVGSWMESVTPSYAGRKDAWCMPTNHTWYPGAGNATAVDWKLCTNSGHAANEPAYYPAHEYGSTSNIWPSLASCSDPQDALAGACSIGLVAIGDKRDRNAAGQWLPNATPTDHPSFPAEWTCACETDSDCQTGAVCNAGPAIVNGIPRFTLCTWDDGSGTSNGAAPEGPIVYGLEQWSDGIVIERDRVVLTGAMLLALWPGALGDDQSFDSFGTLTHCGPDALCSFLGLDEGATVLVDEEDIDDLMDGQTVTITVLQGSSVTRLLYVTVDFDGDLTN